MGPLRAIVVAIVLLLAVPAVGAFGVPRVRPQDTPLLPKDLSDGDLVRLLASHVGAHPKPVKLLLPAGATVPSLVAKLATRANLPLDPSDAARFAGLDARVAAPTLAMLAAVDQAWGMRDHAFARLTPAEQRELALADPQRWTPRQREMAETVDQEELIAAAILLLDTIDDVVTPAVRDAVAAGAWPAEATADSVGVLRIGSPGNDVETLDRIVQIDPSGDDVYRNNAGGASNVLDALTIDQLTTRSFSIAISLDFAGNDKYNSSRLSAIGTGNTGIGIAEDFGGDDDYACRSECVGYALLGIGYFRDVRGDDSFHGLTRSFGDGLGATFDGMAVAREDSGNDTYYLGAQGGGFAGSNPSALGLLWDRSGSDNYRVLTPTSTDNYGFADGAGIGWLVDEGTAIDTYGTSGVGPDHHGCDDCEWNAFHSGLAPMRPVGRGNDNFGGLAHVLAEDNIPVAH